MNTADRLDRVLAQLEGVRQHGHYAEAHCPGPSHRRGDRDRSLSITLMPDGGIRLKCFTGCTHEQIVAAAKINRADLRGDGKQSFAPARSFQPRPTPAPISPRGEKRPRRVKRIGQAAYPVRDATGVLIATKRREDWRLDDGTTEKSCWWEPTLKSLGVAVEDVPLYGSHQLMSLPAGAAVAVVEGEKAAQALHAFGVHAVGTTTGAATIPSPAVLSVLAGYDVTLWPDNDTAGRQHMQHIAGALAELDIGCRWFDWRDAPEKGDAADYLEQHAGDEYAVQILQALLHNAPPWAPPDPPDDPQGSAPPAGEVARMAALAVEIERFLHSQRDMTASDKLVTIEASFALNARERLGDRDDFYLPDAGIAARMGIHRGTVARTRAGAWQRAGITSHKAAAPAELAGVVKDYDATYVALPAGAAPAGARLIATCRVNIPAKPEHKAKGVPRRVPVREVLPETIALCDACPPETPLSVTIVCTGCGQVRYDQTCVCGDTDQTMSKVAAWVKTDREASLGQETTSKVSTWFESAHRRAARQHALATLEPAIPPREGLLIPELDEPIEVNTAGLRNIDQQPTEAKRHGRAVLDSGHAEVESLAGSGKALPAPTTCAICGTSPAPHRTGHRPPLQVCRSCLLAPIPVDDTGRALIVGATYSGSSMAAGGND